MKNFVQMGEVITVIAAAAVTSGDAVLIGSLFGVATTSALPGTPFELKRKGVFTLPALNTDVIAQGAKVYWDAANKRLTSTASGNVLVGALVVAKTNGMTTVVVLLDGTIR